MVCGLSRWYVGDLDGMWQNICGNGRPASTIVILGEADRMLLFKMETHIGMDQALFISVLEGHDEMAMFHVTLTEWPCFILQLEASIK